MHFECIVGLECHNVLLLNPFSVTALLFKMEEANIASRAKAQEFIQATSQVKPGILLRGGHIKLFAPLTYIHMNANSGDMEMEAHMK